MKKILSILCAFCVLSVFASCNHGGDEPKPESNYCLYFSDLGVGGVYNVCAGAYDFSKIEVKLNPDASVPDSHFDTKLDSFSVELKKSDGSKVGDPNNVTFAKGEKYTAYIKSTDGKDGKTRNLQSGLYTLNVIGVNDAIEEDCRVPAVAFEGFGWHGERTSFNFAYYDTTHTTSDDHFGRKITDINLKEFVAISGASLKVDNVSKTEANFHELFSGKSAGDEVTVSLSVGTGKPYEKKVKVLDAAEAKVIANIFTDRSCTVAVNDDRKVYLKRGEENELRLFRIDFSYGNDRIYSLQRDELFSIASDTKKWTILPDSFFSFEITDGSGNAVSLSNGNVWENPTEGNYKAIVKYEKNGKTLKSNENLIIVNESGRPATAN